MAVVDDPRLTEPEKGSSPDAQQVYAEHERTYRGFVTLSVWFVIHVFLILAGIYFVTLGESPYLGGFFWLLALILMGYGILNAAFKSSSAE